MNSKGIRAAVKPATLIGCLLILAGCGTLGVEPWERDLLAKPQMAIVSDPIESGLDDHIYFSKEATSGGRSFAGGGCGCN
ncbi:DUF4266 domain-containing protein [Pleionea litopenaei]|uniref:DUF4266 domain-containing protein n=1 Tax=Pleionea litopenaei TaxID=3070815 RepID=A0AA51RRT8_9GAMM|nr:DUF4266 domain-containing protein [Pleionea sp. HL-JVS1]WMS86430.1 DUF4266 domain-containing protein [Pleionea sp. HL-JVS1]